MQVEEKEIEKIFTGFAIEAKKQLLVEMQRPKKRVIVLAGPTCAGKSEFAIDLAKLIHGEIISADSMQVYRGMDIGTAKVSKAIQEQIPHHLIDIRDVNQVFNVVDFYYEARHCCQQILARNAVPIVVGGSGFYIHSMMYGPPSGPPSIPELREYLENEMEEIGVDKMYEKLKEKDPHYAATITKKDKQKIIRALEIIRLTGKRVSNLSWKGRKRPRNYDFRCWFLHRPKDNLYRLIDKRCEKMLSEGFLEEVRHLENLGIRENTSAAQAIGYRQALDYLDSKQTKEDYSYFIDRFKQATRNYAKRQYTWFRKEEDFRWLDLVMHDYEVALDMVIQDYNSL